MEEILEKVYQLLTVYGLKVLAALAIFIIGRWVAKGVRKLVERVMTKGKVDPTLISFTSNMAYIGLLAFIVIAALGQLGIQTTSFIAILGAAGLAVGLALQGSLSNFAAGFLLIIFRPFKVGDLIEGAGVFGVVEAIQIFTTQLKTADNKTVIVPNAKLTDDNIVNWTVKGTRRVDMVMGIGYEDDIDKARSLMTDVIAADDRILKDPAPQISVSELADSSVNFVVRPWVKVEDYWGVYFDLTEKIKKAFDANGVSIPFPQRDVHVYQHDGDS
ncbi:mechanosensitive ion channel protein [Desulfosarcina alkanivorans]|uniref:Mechanosensitive ion channel protein n=1 Tax=Desulfosarcina alkanivorans TaxID=571177 RepID=A0A5K7YL48_9BACT|nr:mechanosensitive ion channel domain-containing protein [Desulfosarcina alkanivorans]BBO67541.1 mechanosensitive ion channel protein [Desulfosarcina alkanivorans]